MKFTIVSHAGLSVETGDVSILMDPWIVGSCYWRSWWNYPPPPKDLIDGLRPDYIYLTHLHWDHFHGPSLRRFSRATKILVPQAHFGRMLKDLRSMGFTDITELPHGKRIKLQGGTRVTSYQFGLSLDSVLVVSDDETTLMNANDCKIMGTSLNQLRRAHPKIDFVFRSHSSASAYPHCVRSYNQDHLTWRTNEHYLAEFLAFAGRLNARYAIPFASNNCFLHRETREFNETVVSPLDVKTYFDEHNRGEGQCAVMVAGDSWSSTDGLCLADQDYFTNRQENLDRLATQYAEKLADFYRQEDAAQPRWDHFERYFTGLLKALPWLLKPVFPARVLFKVRSEPPVHWLVDFKARRVQQVPDDRVQCHFVIEVHPAVLNDCVRKRMFAVFTASKRLRIEIRKGPLRNLLLYNGLVDMYESGYFPVSGLLSRRFMGCWVRRWREILWYTGLALQVGVMRRRFVPSEHF